MTHANGWSRRILAFALGVALVVIQVPVAVGTPEAAPVNLLRPLSFGATAQRVHGADRFETCAALSRHVFERADYVVIASGRDFPDALVAGPLAAALRAPLLLTEPNVLPTAVATEVRRLGASQAVIVGGENAVASTVVVDLVLAGVRAEAIERIGGEDRYETAAMVASRLAETVGSCARVVLATGEDFPDALAVSSFAGATGCPVLLTRCDVLPGVTERAIAGLNADTTLVVGGELAVSSAVEACVPDPVRVEGANRYETARAVAEHAFLNGLCYRRVTVVSGSDFPDALCAGVWGALERTPLVLTDGKAASSDTVGFFEAHCTSIESILVVGGERAVSVQAVRDLTSAARTRLSRDVVVLSDDSGSSLETISPDGSHLRFNADAHEARSLVTSDVLVAGPSAAAPDGYLMRVLSVTDDDGAISVETTAATLADVIVKGSIDITGCVGQELMPEVESGGVEPSASMGTAVEIPFESSFSRTGEPVEGSQAAVAATVGGKATLQGSFALNASWGHLYYEDHWWGVTSVSGLQSVTFTTFMSETLQADLDVTMEAQWAANIIDAIQDRVGRELYAQVGSTWFWVGWVPVNITFRVRPVATVELDVAADLAVGLTQRSSVLYGLRYDYGVGWRPIRWAYSGFDVRGPDMTGSARAALQIGAVLDCLFYNAAGPYFGLSGTLALDADTTVVPWWTARVNVKGVYGGRIDVFGVSSSCEGSALFCSRVLDQADGGF
ncbi:MAG: cell wall-binding repeat-containing protein [Actinomycetota bacterium]|jgi:putative cell wall-binding protein|nr:cell wall-binding repeat-containing protein [Actinomycetota bacterium]